ncbi:hypothetical protein HYH02_008374 [Chlamydomonas schloesseri]|uniref:DNA polymerase kappa n=1 Tax=Chlamydomonas schloesseri TaxID=2026947 RepID=A0A836B488_9CHLO|nr:hypothetical protein HYH02_008374 [Chlamydomonas schloesseri]|eukprot:KAG2446814.1 hypothetical protein HYH02_008374 [Chlamydomonas schloesseri]
MSDACGSGRKADGASKGMGVLASRDPAQPPPSPPQPMPQPQLRPPQQLQQSGAAPAWKDYQTVFTNAKAGMDGVDKARVQQIVWEMSKDSAHFKNEQRKQAGVLERIERMKQRSDALTPAELAAAGRSMDARITGCEARRDLTRTWLHVDMDCFYAAVHGREQPELKRLPVAVGGMGMISTANYVARRFGVRSAMPGFIGKRLCPKLVFVKPDFAKYTAAAAVVRGAFRQLDPDFESGGLDEAYLDVTDYCARTGRSGEEAAAELRRLVQEASGGLTCSVGVAANKMLAKICSDINKPDGQYVLPASRGAIMSFLDTLPVRKIPCIGKVTEQVLQGVLGVSTCGQLLAPDSRCRLPLLFSEAAAGFFLEAALGLADTRHAPKTDTSVDPGRKGISHERTFRNMSAPAEQEAMATQLVEALVSDMEEEGIEGRNITLKLKLSTFEVHTRAATLPRHARTVSDILPAVLRLLRAEMPVTIRLMGVRMATLRKVNAGAKSPLARLLGLRCMVQQPADAQKEGAASGSGATPHDVTVSPQPLPGYGSAPPACVGRTVSGSQAAGVHRGGSEGCAAMPAASAPAAGRSSAWPAPAAAASLAGPGAAAAARTWEPGESPRLLARGHTGHDRSAGAGRPPQGLQLALPPCAPAPGVSGRGLGPGPDGGTRCSNGGSEIGWELGHAGGGGSAPTTPRVGAAAANVGQQAMRLPPRPPPAAVAGAAGAGAAAYGSGGAGPWDALDVEQQEVSEDYGAQDEELKDGLQDEDAYLGAEVEDEAICILDSDDDLELGACAGPTGGAHFVKHGHEQAELHCRSTTGEAAQQKRPAEPAAVSGADGPTSAPGLKRPRTQAAGGGGAAGASAPAGAGCGAAVHSATAGAVWTCQVCTYARNRRQFLRCEMCDTRKGETRGAANPARPVEQEVGSCGRKQQAGWGAGGAVVERNQRSALAALLQPTRRQTGPL